MKKNRNSKRTKPSAVPGWLLARHRETSGQWQKRKEAEMRALCAAFQQYQRGCAYCAVQLADIELIEVTLASLRRAHKP